MKPRISYSEFELPFFVKPSSDEVDEEDNLPSRWGNPEVLEEQIPTDAIPLGNVNSSVANWRDWKVDDYFYFIPWREGRFSWAIFRISWDDNWSRYEFLPEARIAGVTDPTDASRRLLRGLFRKWGIDLRKRRSLPYKDLLG
jgi:hypothetical protein